MSIDIPAVERRRMSQAGLLDSAINVAHQIVTSSDPRASALARRLLDDLMQLRRELPVRRLIDRNPRQR